MLPQIVTLWISGALSPIEQLCLSSFVQNGHPVTLYHYEPVSNVPAGVELRNADDVLPWWFMCATLRDRKPNLVANWFRLLLMRREAGLWVDTDVVCLRPITIDAPLIAGWESDDYVNNAVMRLERESPILIELLEHFDMCGKFPFWTPLHKAPMLYLKSKLRQPFSPSDLPRGTLGPKGLTAMLRKHGGEAQAREVFYPIHPRNAFDMFGAAPLASLVTERSLAIHLWNEKIRGMTIPPRSPLAELMRLYGAIPIPA